MVVRVKPEYNGKISIQSNTALNETVLSNNLNQETLFSIFMNESGLREFLYTEYTTANGSYAPSQIDPSLLHAYDASEITQNPVKTDYPVGTVGKYLNETANKINSISTISTRPQSILDFAGAKILPSYATFSRASIGSYVDVNGIIKVAKAGQPRFTHNPITKESLGILIEESVTNLILKSADLGLSPWTFTDCNFSLGRTLAPDGTVSANIVQTTAVNHALKQVYTCQPSTTYTFSFWAKNINMTRLTHCVYDNTNSANISLVDYFASVTSTGWTRISVTFTTGATTSSIGLYTLRDCGVTGQVAFWGVQLEKGTNLSSYIPTDASVVTRAADALYIPVKNVPQAEGTFVVSGISPGKSEITNNGNRRIIALNTFDIAGYTPLGDMRSWDSNNILALGAGKVGGGDDIAIGYTQTARRISLNATSVQATTFLPSVLNNVLNIGSNGGTNFLNGTIKRLTIYSRMLTDTELVKVTTATLSSNQAGGIPANADLGQLAYVDATTILSALNRQELSIDGTAASITRNIRRPYDFSFSIVDSSGVTVTSQPAVSCLANTDNALIFTAPVGKTITYAIIPYFEY